MSKPKNPNMIGTFSYNQWMAGYAQGVADSEKRLERALRRLMRRQKEWSYVSLIDLDNFLTARAKRRNRAR